MGGQERVGEWRRSAPSTTPQVGGGFWLGAAEGVGVGGLVVGLVVAEVAYQRSPTMSALAPPPMT